MKKKVILDTDLGYDPDDVFAILLLLNSQQIDIKLIITGDEVEGKRAQFLYRILKECGREDIPIVQGKDNGRKDFIVDELLPKQKKDISKEHLEEVKKILEEEEEITYIGIQGFGNLAEIIENVPKAIEKLKIFQMGGAHNYIRRPGWIEHNVKIDLEAAKKVVKSGADIHLVMAQTTFNKTFEIHNQTRIYQKLTQSNKKIHQTLLEHIRIFKEKKTYWSFMHDPLTVSCALGEKFVDFYEDSVNIDEQGNMVTKKENPKIKLSKKETKDKEFMSFLEARLFPN